MGFLRDLRSDLVEKRLWPLALLLLVALVAVPLVLAKSPQAGTGSSEPLPSPPAGATPVAGVPAVSLATTSIGRARLIGRAKDPFRQQHVPPKASTSTGTISPSGTTGAGGTSGSTSGGSAPTPTKPPAAKKVYVVSHVDVRFGKVDSTLKTIDDVARLTPLPSASNPVAIFLGMRSDEKTAVFMISSDVKVHGTGRCTPSVSECDAVELKAGEVALLAVTGSDGKVTQYELDLVKVTVQHTTSKAQAEAARARASRAGRRLVHRRAATSAVAAALRYSPLTGFLTPVPGSTFLSQAGSSSAADDGSVPQAVAGERRAGWVALAP